MNTAMKWRVQQGWENPIYILFLTDFLCSVLFLHLKTDRKTVFMVWFPKLWKICLLGSYCQKWLDKYVKKGNNSFFYPSASTSFILSDIFGIKNTFDFWKLRLSVAGVGNGTKPYRLDRYYSIGEISGSVVAPNTLNNINLLPEKNTNYEGGMDFSMFKNRLGLNFTFYKNITKNQIVEIPALTESGFRSRFINSGSVENKGLEITLNATPIKGQTLHGTLMPTGLLTEIRY